jgi:hypothetical protein
VDAILLSKKKLLAHIPCELEAYFV